LLRRALHRNIHDLYLANAEHQRRFLLSFACLPPERVLTVANGVDTDLFFPGPAPDPVALGLPRTAHYAVTICQARPEKRVDFLLEVARHVFALRPDLSLTFVHVGDGQCLAAWRAKARALGLEGRFCFAGYHNNVAPFHRLASFLVHAAERESFGLVLAEAMATHKPVIATASPGPREIIEEGVTGFVLDQQDVEGVARAILRLCEDAALREALGARALERVRQRFSLQRQAQTIATLLEGYLH
jgi:glycosyltransferase involved in cell wall biosynthesis